jgi:hypothetical protein
MKNVDLIWRMDAYGMRKILVMDSQQPEGASAGWILRVQIDLEWEEGAFRSRPEAEAYFEQLLTDYGARIGSAELITPTGDTEELTGSRSQRNVQ